jgi:7-cyano-7-deazaguanine synthase
MDKKYVLLFSGGQDSTTCLHWILERTEADNVLCVFFDYGQQHLIAEREAASSIADSLNIAVEEVSLHWKTQSDLTRFGAEISEDNGAGLPTSFVAGRNLMMLTAAASLVYPIGFDYLVIGANAVDYSGYPDCRGESLLRFEQAINAAMDTHIKIEAPLINLSKAEIVKLSESLGATNSLAKSHTCYHGVSPGCGKCPSCKIRAEGYRQAGIIDPIWGSV